jgi:hypothetical protein
LATSVGAKEGVVARPLTPIPRHAEPGARVTAVWTLYALAGTRRVPFDAEGIFARLLGPNGSHSRRVWATRVYDGRYRATVTVPRGGIRLLVIGLMGTSCDPGGCRPAPGNFEIVGRMFR